MKFIITQPNLFRGLSITEKIIGRNLTLPILQNILVSCEKNKGCVRLCSTNLEIGVEVLIPAKIEQEGSITIPARLFLGLVQNLPDEKVEVSEKNNTILVQCKNYKANIKGEPAGEFPLIPSAAASDVIRVKNDALRLGISSVISCASPLDVKPEITGIYTQFQKRDMCFAATDSFRLAEKKILTDTKNTHQVNVIIPKRTGEAILRVFEGAEQTLHVQTNENQLFIQNVPQDSSLPHVRLVSRVIAGEYPNYEQIIPTTFSTTVEVSRDEIVSHIKSASLFSLKVNEVRIQTNPAKQELGIESRDQECGNHSSTIPCLVQGKEVGFAFNYTYLLDGIQNIPSATIVMKCNEATTPVLITSPEGDGFRYVVMPIKT